MKKIVSFILVGCLIVNCYSQEFKIAPILQKLFQSNANTIAFPLNQETIFKINDLPDFLLFQNQILLKRGKELYLFPSGTGRVYKLKQNKDKFTWQRIDSTFFTGYNYNALYFFIDSNLYSFGGEGFWKENGELRQFSYTSNSWNAIPVSEYIAKAFPYNLDGPSFFYVDQNSKSLYIIGPQHLSFTVKNRFTQLPPHANELLKLNVTNGDWEVVGNLRDTGFKIWGQSAYGLFVSGNTLLDVLNNEYYTLSTNKRDEFEKILTNPRRQHAALSYFIDSTLFIGDLSNWIDSIKLVKSDFLPTGVHFYKPINNSKFKYQIEIFILLFMIFIIEISFYYFKLKNKLTNVTKKTPSIKEDLPFNNFDFFDEKELGLLKKILEDSRKNKTTSITTINKTIGVKNKSTEIQKRNRGEVLNSINQKWSLKLNDSTPIIIKKRSDLDKRSFEYFIDENKIDILIKLLNQ